MNAPATFPNRTAQLAAAVNRALDKNRDARMVIELLSDWQVCNIGTARGSTASEFHQLKTEHKLAAALSDLFGCDSFEEMRSNASDELWTEHSWNASEGRALDASEMSL